MDRSRPGWGAFRVTVAVLAAVPLASGLAGVVRGPGAVPGGPGGPVSPSLDSEYRFANTFWCAVAPAIWWTLRDPVGRAGVLRAVLGTVAAGGPARIVSWRRFGRPHAVFVGALALEVVGMPAVLLWQRALLRSTSAEMNRREPAPAGAGSRPDRRGERPSARSAILTGMARRNRERDLEPAQPTGPLTAESVHRWRFSPVRLREGYDMSEVDDFLDRVAARLTELQADVDVLRAGD